MKTKLANLQASVSTSLSDLDKTVTSGRAIQKTVDGLQVIAPPLTTWADVNVAYGIAPGNCDVNPATGRKFELQNTNAGSPVILAFTFNLIDGTWVYIGKITVVLPPGTHLVRGFSFDDTNVNNIKLMISDTVTTALCQGGTYFTWNVALTDFTPLGTTIFLANDDNQKAVYFAQNPTELGRAHLGITSSGITSGVDCDVVANQTKFFQLNGTGTTLQIYGWDTAIGAPVVDGKIVNGVDAQTTPFAGTSPAAYFRMSAQNGYSTLANTTAAFETVILKNGTNPIPANFVQTITTQTQYFMRDLQFVSGAWYFNLATTNIGAAVVPTSTTSSFTMMRGNGITSNQFLFKTGIITPALVGTLTASNSFVATVPTNVPAAPTLNGTDCLSFATVSNLYLAKISDLSNGITSIPSLSTVNALGTGVDIVSPSISLARYSKSLDKWLYITNTMKFVLKPHASNVINRVFGSLINTYYEAQNPVAVPAGVAALTAASIADGWLFITSGTTTGQRGVVSCDLKSDSLFDYSYVVSPVLQVESGSTLKFISTIEALYDYTDAMNFYIKNSTNPVDPIFSNNSGWTEINAAEDNSPLALGPYFRIKVTYNNATYGLNTPSQLNDLVINYVAPNENSDKWEMSRDLSSNGSPSRTVFRLKELYSSIVPTLHYRANDLTNSNLINHTTVANAANFEYSTNNGLTWLPLGTIPNTVGTLVRYTFSSPPGIDIRPSLREE